MAENEQSELDKKIRETSDLIDPRYKQEFLFFMYGRDPSTDFELYYQSDLEAKRLIDEVLALKTKLLKCS